MSNETIVVSSSQELATALREASGGETILLKGDARYSVSLADKTFASTVTIRSLDSQDQAVLSSVKLDGVANLRVDDVTIHSTSRLPWRSDVFVEDSRNIVVSNSTLTGDAASFNNGHVKLGDNAVRIKGTDGFTFTNNEVSHYNFGIQVTGSDRVSIQNNDLHHMQADGMQFSDVDDVVVDGNHLHDFLGSAWSINHNDMIQFFTSGTTSPSQNVVVRNNVLDSGQGHWTQAIFFGNEAVNAGAGNAMRYKNVLIENNTVYNNTFHGITVDKAEGLTIRNNTVLRNTETAMGEVRNDGIYIMVKPGSANVSVSGNVAERILVESPATQTANLTLDYKNPNAANYVGNLLDTSQQLDKAHVTGVKLAAGVHGGSTLTRPTSPEPDDDTGDTHVGGPGNDRIMGSDGDDTLYGGGGGDTLYGQDGDDTLDGGGGNDKLNGGSGHDLIRGGDGNDLVRSGDGDDTVLGGSGNDGLRGEAGNDIVRGGGGRDMLWGDAGNDTLDGGTGLDNYHGGAGNDVFVLVKGEIADDRINDYSAGDAIQFQGFDDPVVTHLYGSVYRITDADHDSAVFRVVNAHDDAIHWLFG